MAPNKASYKTKIYFDVFNSSSLFQLQVYSLCISCTLFTRRIDFIVWALQ